MAHRLVRRLVFNITAVPFSSRKAFCVFRSIADQEIAGELNFRIMVMTIPSCEPGDGDNGFAETRRTVDQVINRTERLNGSVG